MRHTATIGWFARHEFGLFWRDWTSVMTAGKRERERKLLFFVAIGALLMHGLAFLILAPLVKGGLEFDTPVLVFTGGTLLLSVSLMLSQALESVTRAFYARDDLDLILSSPALVQRLFGVRIVAISITVMAMSMLLAFPFVNVLAYLDGVGWLASYGVIASLAALTTALAIGLTIAMFVTIGPARTRFFAQILAAVVGATFVIGIQIVAILYYGNISRLDVLTSDFVYALAPATDSLLWLPVRALRAEILPLILIIGLGLTALALVVKLAGPHFGEFVLSTGSISKVSKKQSNNFKKFRSMNPARALRQKEWTLLKRDPWLVSQTLMQILYLLPPAFLLWRNFSGSATALVMLVPVIVMAAGQLSGGLAWLAVSGEDAPDLVSTAPVAPGAVMRAKIEAVLISILTIVAPLVLILAIANPWIGFVTAIGVCISSISSITIQLWFRKQARRTHFRRRQVSSRAATFAEAFSSILWAGTAGVTAAGSWFAIGLAIPALVVMLIARSIAPRQN